MALEIFVSENVDNFMDWLRAIDDPAKKCDIYLKLVQYYVPKLTHVTGSVNVRHSITDFTDEELAIIAAQVQNDSIPAITDERGNGRPN